MVEEQSNRRFETSKGSIAIIVVNESEERDVGTMEASFGLFPWLTKGNCKIRHGSVQTKPFV